MNPLINIVTRVSRKDYFDRCYKSVQSQSYKNINHICTFQNDEMGIFLSSYKNINNLKVPDFKHIPDLYLTYFTNSTTDNFSNPDWDFLDRKIQLSKDISAETKPVQSKRYEKYFDNDVFYFCTTLDFAFRHGFRHFPYNQFMKMAEKKFKEGWVYCLDDDDYFTSDNSLQIIVDEINKFNEDYLHIFRVFNHNENRLKPVDNYWLNMSIGHPFILNEIGNPNFVYHTKWSDFTFWDEWEGADYRTLKSLEGVVPNKNFVDKIITDILKKIN